MVYYSSSGKFLTRESLVIQVREALTAAGLDTKYPGSSFTQEAATTVLEKEISDAVIKCSADGKTMPMPITFGCSM